MVLIFGVIWAIAFGQDSPTNQAYLFAADAETFLYQDLKTTFSCQGRDYGYYADADNNCQVSHQCRINVTWPLCHCVAY